MWKSVAVAVCVLNGVCLAEAKTITVGADGDFKTVQEAIAAAPDSSQDETTIRIKEGTYTGPFIIDKKKTHLHLLGDGSEKTILTWDRNVNDPKPEGGDGFNPGMYLKADDFTAENLTIQNTSGDHGQALAMKADSDRVIMKNVHLVGWQDTLMINNGRYYFTDCYIAGRVDFIYGSATAWFENCEIHSRNGGHVTAASTPEDHPFGYVFNNCKLTGDKIPFDPATTNPATTQKAKVTPRADLGRPWRAFASVTYLNCEMGDHIAPTGWNNWGKAANEKTARYSEYNTTGPGANPGKRVAWAKQLTADDAAKITVESVLGGKDNWNPKAQK